MTAAVLSMPKNYNIFVVMALLAVMQSAHPGVALGQSKANETETSDARLRTIAASGDKKQFLVELASFIAERPNDADRLAYGASLADVAGANMTAIKLYEDFKRRFPKDPRIPRVEQLITRLEEEEAECPEAFVDQTPESEFYLVDTIRKHVIRWDASRMPVKVCIRQSSPADATPASFFSVTKTLFDEWSAAANGAIKFVFVTDPNAADIDVMWTRDRSKSPLPGKQGVTTYDWKDSAVNKAKIVCLSVRYLSDNLINERSARHVVIHEIGHALGLGHSKNIHDAMYFGNMTPEVDAKVSDNDRKMLERLYTASDKDLEEEALAVARKYGGPEREMIAQMLQDWADVAMVQGDYPRAEKLLLQARETLERLNLSKRELFANTRDLARVYRQQNKYAEAIPYYAACVEIMKSSGQNEADLIVVLQNLAASQRAAKQYRECKNSCLQLLPLLQKRKAGGDALATLYMELGTLAYNDRDFQESEHYYQQACNEYAAQKTKTVDARMAAENLQLASAYLKSQVFKDRIELPFSGKGNRDDWYKANEMYRQANRMMAQGNDEKTNEAIAKYKEAIATYPYDSAYYFNLAHAQMRLHHTAEAAATYSKAADLNPQSFSMIYWYGVASYSDKKFDQAKEAFLKAVTLTHSPEDDNELKRYMERISAAGSPEAHN